jgi:AAA15 family ATPase/GTPase
VSVHRADCPNAINGMNREAEKGRWMKVTWDAGSLNTYKTSLEIIARDRVNLALDVTTALASTKMPLLSFLAINYSIPVIVEVIRWFEECIIRDYANPLAEQQILLSDDNVSKKQFLSMMNDMGIGITGYRFDQQSNEFYLQRTLHDALYELPFSSESDGTRKLFAALPVILMALKEGRLVIVDELDAKLHPTLLRYVIRLFTNPEINKKGAQLLFTSHDMSTMKNSIFRRDEIWFAALDSENSSEVYSLSELRKENNDPINNTAAYDKQYLEGRYGADPYLKNMLSWEV